MNKHKYFVFNKPNRTICTLKSSNEYLTINNYISNLNFNNKELHLIGRLDYWSRGVILLTNNGKLSYKLTHPDFKVSKKYIIKAKGIPSKKSIYFIQKRIAGLITFKIIGITKNKNSWFEITLFSGTNKQIVNIFWFLNTPILKLVRISFAKITISNLHSGNIRKLTYKEVLKLYQQIKE